MSYSIVTVATEPKGMFNDLINNKFDVKVNVLGMGKQWTGYKMKYELVYDFIKTKDDEHVIIFLDGYDSEIKQNPQIAYDKFIRNEFKMLVSSDIVNNENNNAEWMSLKMFQRKCRDGYMANTGMYMAKVKYLKTFLEYALKQKCRDDQRILNQSCVSFEFITVDKNEEIFQNFIPYWLKEKNPYNDKAVFVSYPARFTFDRYSRFYFEYAQFFLKEILLVYVLFIGLIFFAVKSRNLKFMLTFASTLLIIIWLVNSDYSCII